MKEYFKNYHLTYLGLVITAACLVVAFGCNTQPYDVYSSVFRIKVSGGQGSGCLIGVQGDKGLCLTARHVAVRVDATANLYWPYAGGQHTVGLVAETTTGSGLAADMALVITVLPEGVQPLAVAKFDPNNGPWRCFGFKGDVPCETVATEAKEHDGIVELDQPFTVGMSGGPVLDRNDCVVAVVVASDKVSTGIASNGKTLAALVSAHLR